MSQKKINEVSVTDLKIDFTNIMTQAEKEGVIFITRYGKPQFALMSYEHYLELTNARQPNS